MSLLCRLLVRDMVRTLVPQWEPEVELLLDASRTLPWKRQGPQDTNGSRDEVCGVGGLSISA